MSLSHLTNLNPSEWAKKEGLVLFLNQDFGYIGLIDAWLACHVALERHSRSANAFQLFVPCPIRMVLTEPPNAKHIGILIDRHALSSIPVRPLQRLRRQAR